jgi:hypothetical protein
MNTFVGAESVGAGAGTASRYGFGSATLLSAEFLGLWVFFPSAKLKLEESNQHFLGL